MGICSSCDVAASAVAAAPPATAKLIYPDGRLEEHPGGKVPACHALGFAASADGGAGEDDGMIVCSADEMEFGGYVTGLGECDVLQPGQIYFALPRSVLRRAMAPEDMAALAVRASTALVRSGIVVAQAGGGGGGEWGAGGRKCKGTVQADRSWAGDVDVVQQRRRAATVAGTGGGGNGNAGGNRRRKMSRGRSFSSDLIAIPE